VDLIVDDRRAEELHRAGEGRALLPAITLHVVDPDLPEDPLTATAADYPNLAAERDRGERVVGARQRRDPAPGSAARPVDEGVSALAHGVVAAEHVEGAAEGDGGVVEAWQESSRALPAGLRTGGLMFRQRGIS
jgi:hypothetical protein